MRKNRSKIIMAVSLLFVVANIYAADPPVFKKQPVQKTPIKQFSTKTNFKADLRPVSVGFSSELCLESCSRVYKEELNIVRIKNGCNLMVRVKNEGGARSNPGKVRIMYRGFGRDIKLEGNMPAIPVGQATDITIPVPTDRNHIKDRYISASIRSSIIATVDTTNTTAESNERNNVKKQFMSQLLSNL